MKTGMAPAGDAFTTLYHRTDVSSANEILANGFDMSRATELGGGDALWTTTSPTDAEWFAAANPRGGAPAVLRITVPNPVIASLASKNLLSVEGCVYRFQPEAMDALNRSATIRLVTPQ